MRHHLLKLARLISLAIGVVSGPAFSVETAAQKFPDVLAAEVRATSTDTFDFDVTVSSPYDTPQRYADGFRVLDADGAVYGERKLWHDHAGEQPFTRDLYGVKLPGAIRAVIIQARDQRFGYGGKTIEITLPGR
jgi:hypothetical protein